MLCVCMLHCVWCVVLCTAAAHGVRRTSPQKVTMLMRLPSDDPTLAILRFSLSQLAGVPIDAFCVVARSLPHTSHYCQPEVVRHRSESTNSTGTQVCTRALACEELSAARFWNANVVT